jgi:hypothetical protein
MVPGPGSPGEWPLGKRWQTGSVQNHINRLDPVFPVAAMVALNLIRRGEIRDQWLLPSALPKMSVGALACHLRRQVVRAAELLAEVTDVPPLESADAHYYRAAWVTSTSPDDPPNDRSADDAEAARGPAALADDLALSVGVRTPEFPDEVFALVRDLLVRLAVRRHGQSAVISALTRSERTRVISAF